MPVHELAALGAALCWAVTGILGAGPAAALGPLGFGRLRHLLVTAMLLVAVLVGGVWHDVTAAQILPLILSGLIGIFVGDTVLYFCMLRLGPRRTGALFALNAPIAALLGWTMLDETLSGQAILGIVLCAAGVMLAVLGRPGRSGGHRFEAVRGNVWAGIALGLLAALGQAVGSLIARPVMETGIDPVAASLIRVGTAAASLTILMALPVAGLKQTGRITPRILGQTALSGFLAMGLGMTLLLFALSGGKVGIVSTLSALSPVFILPVLWAITGARPSVTSWVGAIIAVAGMALVFLR
ncbi:DMT family transporter [Paracoccus pacificus]|uniref:DMT family transporter n=1 Tax=Paracoccus pacificus TaxID=1463598 RepID=A0ABW4RC02_9RHOB